MKNKRRKKANYVSIKYTHMVKKTDGRMESVDMAYFVSKCIAKDVDISSIELSERVKELLYQSHRDIENQNRRIKNWQTEFDEELPELADRQRSMLDDLVQTKQIEKIVQAFRTITEKQQRRFILHHVYGYTCQQIADKEKVSLRRVEQSVQSAKLRMLKELEKRSEM